MSYHESDETRAMRVEILALRRENARLREIIVRNSQLDIEGIWKEGRTCEVLRTIKTESQFALRTG